MIQQSILCFVGLVLLAGSGIVLQIALARLDSAVIRVHTTRGNDSLCRDGRLPCRSMKQANVLLKEYGHNVTVVVEDNATLHTVFEVINSTNIRIVGSGASLIYINCTPGNAGFIIDNVDKFIFSNIAVANCTANHTRVTSQRFALLVHSSSNILIKDARFERCNFTAVLLLNNHQMNIIESVWFVGNHVPGNRKKHVSQWSRPGALGIIQNGTRNESVYYNISTSTFHYNFPPIMSNTAYVSNSSTFKARGYGGAVYIEFGGNTSRSMVTINRTKFTYNVATRGGGVYAFYTDSASRNRIHILSCKFIANYADTSGGGLDIGYYNSPSLQNEFLIKECLFIHNEALTGGAMDIYSSYSYSRLTHFKTIVLTNNTFEENRATLSAAVDIAPLLHEIGGGFLPVPNFTDCSFTSNTLIDSGKRSRTRHTNTGIFSIKLFKVLFGGETTFLSNRYSAILLLSGVVEFRSNSRVVFSNNTGHNGGAIAMFSLSVILLNPYSFLNFSKNTAIGNGGAIYYSTSDQHSFLKSDKHCFIKNSAQLDNLTLINTTRVVFEGNKASENHGKSMYAESFESCHHRCKSLMKARNFKHSTENVFKCTGNFTLDKGSRKGLPLMSSASRFTFYSKRSSYFAYPGYSIKLPFAAVDDFKQKIKPLMSITRKNDEMNSNISNTLFVRDPYTLSNHIFPFGVVNSSTTLTVTVLGRRQIRFDFKVTLIPCPPGYYNWKNICKCAVGTHGYPSITKCDDFQFSAIYKNSLWAGYIPESSKNHTDLYFAPCVAPLCNDSNHNLPKYHKKMVGQICTKNRTGLMCGRCVDDYSTHYHSRHLACGPSDLCHLGMLFYTLSEIIPMVIFFIIVVTFEINFTSGKVVSFVFYTQYLSQLTIHINPVFSYLRMPYRIFYGLFNFEFFNIEQLSFCLFKDSQVLDVIAMRYVTIVMAFGLVLIVIAILRNYLCIRFFRISNRPGVSAKISVVHGLSAFLVICYAQCTKTSFYILKYTRPVGFKGIYGDYYSYYGGLPYLHGKHLIYAVPALLSLVFVTILPPLVLLLYPLSLHLLSLCGLSEHWIVNKTLQLTGINKLKPFIDCFQSCYKDRLRFFAGLYFVYRVAILLVYGMKSDSFGFSLYSCVLLLTIVGIHSSVRPFREACHNTLDSLILFNLAFINGCVLISKYLVNQLDDPNMKTEDPYIMLVSTIQLALLYLPMLVIFFHLGKIGLTHIKAKLSRDQMIGVHVDDILDHGIREYSPIGDAVSSSRSTYGTVQIN